MIALRKFQNEKVITLMINIYLNYPFAGRATFLSFYLLEKGLNLLRLI